MNQLINSNIRFLCPFQQPLFDKLKSRLVVHISLNLLNLQIMTELYYDNQTFTGVDFANQTPVTSEFDGCVFKGCNFANCDFSGISLIDCKFDNCNLSLLKLSDAGLKNVLFIECKVIGVDFSLCDKLLFEVGFEQCSLEFAYFFGNKMKGVQFKNCKIKEANFSEADLTGSIFYKCDLENTIFDRTNLQRADFRTSINYQIDPLKNNIKKAKFSYQGVIGLLTNFDIEIE